MLALVFKIHRFHHLKVKVITESMFPLRKEAAGAVAAAVVFHLLQAGLECVKCQSSQLSGCAIKTE